MSDEPTNQEIRQWLDQRWRNDRPLIYPMDAGDKPIRYVKHLLDRIKELETEVSRLRPQTAEGAIEALGDQSITASPGRPLPRVITAEDRKTMECPLPREASDE